RRRQTRPNVLILAADSLRPERVRGAIMPHWAALSDGATAFERAFVPMARTLSSWVSMLTGRYPLHHGVRSMFPRWQERSRPQDSLPARLAAAGYRTAGVSDFGGEVFSE